MNIGALTVTLGVDASGLIAGQRTMLNFEKSTIASINTMAQRFRTFGYLATVALTVPLISAGKSSINMYKDFEFSMQKIVGLVGITQGIVNRWKESLLKMAPEVAQTPQALAEALYFVSSAGFKSAEALNITEIAAKAATAGLGETADVAKLLVFTMNAYKSSGLTASRAADVFTVAVREGAIEAEGFASAMQSVLPIASALGVTVDQVAGTMAAMSLQGATAARSATYLRGMLNSLLKIKPGSIAEKSLNALGTSGEKLLQVLRQQGLMSLLIQLQELSSKETGNVFLKQIFRDIRGMTGALSLVGENLKANVEVVNKVTGAYKDLGKAGVAVAETVKKRMDSMSASAKVAWIKLGQSISAIMIPILEWLVKILNKVITAFDALSKPVKTIIILVGVLAAAIGPLAILTSLFIYMTPAVLALGKAFIWLETAMLGINVWVALAAVIGGVALAIYKHAKASTEMQRIQSEVNKQIGTEIFSLNSIFTKLKEATKGTDERTYALKLINERYSPYLKNLLTEKSTLEDIEKAQKAATNALIADISVKNYKTQLEKVLKDVSSSFDKQFKTFMDAFSTSYGGDRLGELVTALFEGADQALKASGGKFEKGVLGYSQTARDIWKEFIEPISQQTGYLKYSLGDFTTAFQSFLDVKSKKTGTIETLQAMISWFEKLIPATGMADTGLKGIKTDLDDAAEAAKALNEELANINKWYLEQYNQRIKSGKGLGGGFALNTDKTPTDYGETNYLKFFAKTAGLNTPNATIDSLTKGIVKQTEVVNVLTNAFTELFSKTGKGFQGMIDNFLQGINKLISEMIAKALIWVILDMITGGGAGAFKAFMGFTENLPKIAGGAKGGTVPGGFPNDTYPILLSSGEKVIPVGIGHADTIRLEVDTIRVAGKDLAIVLRRAGQYN